MCRKALSLGPLYSILSVRNLPSATKHCKARQYADDVSLYKAGKDLNQITLDLAEDITIVRDFLAARGLCLNPDKTQFIIFRSKFTPLTPDVSLQLNNTSIAPLPEVKYLGIVLDEHLTFCAHIAHLGLSARLETRSPCSGRYDTNSRSTPRKHSTYRPSNQFSSRSTGRMRLLTAFVRVNMSAWFA